MPTSERAKSETKPAPGDEASRLHLVLRIVALALGPALSIVALAAWLAPHVGGSGVALGLGAALVLLPALTALRWRDQPALVVDALAVGWLALAALLYGPAASALHDPLVALSSELGGEGLGAVADFVTGTPAPEAEEEP